MLVDDRLLFDPRNYPGAELPFETGAPVACEQSGNGNTAACPGACP